MSKESEKDNEDIKELEIWVHHSSAHYKDNRFYHSQWNFSTIEACKQIVIYLFSYFHIPMSRDYLNNQPHWTF